MNSGPTDGSPRLWSPRLYAAVSGVLLGLMAGCPNAGLPTGGAGGDMGTGNTGMSDDTGAVTARIVNISTNFGLSELQPPISVFYTVTGAPDSISAFYVPVADSNPGAAAIGDRVTIADNLPAGVNRTFNFDPAAAGIGFFRVGIFVVDEANELVAESTGIIQVQAPPNPVFIQPTEPVTEVAPGAEVFVSFDAGDPEGDAQWRLFYLGPNDPGSDLPDELGTQIAVGSGNVGTGTFLTEGLPAGDYVLGVSATDSGSSVAATVAGGNINQIVTVFGPIVRISE